MQVIKIINGAIGENTYVFFDEKKKEGVVIDPSFDYKKVIAVMEEEGISCAAILLTHGHFDHIAGVDAIRDRFDAPVYIGEKDADMLTDDVKNCGRGMGISLVCKKGPEHTIKDGDVLELGGMQIKVIGTPGHSPGSVCFAVEDVLFTGDTLFNLSIGRSDLPGGELMTLMGSLRKLKNLYKNEKIDYIVHPGHEESSSLAYEADNNPFMP